MVARTFAIFVIVALSGVPASVALCEGWCPTIEAPAASSGTACHETAPSGGAPRLASRDHDCHHALSSTSAVVDIRPSGSAARAAMAEVECSSLLRDRAAFGLALGSPRGAPPPSVFFSPTFLRI
jgi:hypothetical protein